MHDAARSQLIADHMEMAMSLAVSFANSANLLQILSRDDVRAYAQQGLVEAANRYKPDCGIDFRTYSRRRICGAIIDGVRKHSLDGYSRKLHQKFTARHGEHASRDGYRAQIFFDSFRAYRRKPDNDVDYPREPADQEAHAPDVALDRKRLRETLLSAINALPPRERAVTLRHYYSGEKLRDICADGGDTYDTVRRLHANSLRHLRSALSRNAPGALESVQ